MPPENTFKNGLLSDLVQPAENVIEDGNMGTGVHSPSNGLDQAVSIRFVEGQA